MEALSKHFGKMPAKQAKEEIKKLSRAVSADRASDRAKQAERERDKANSEIVANLNFIQQLKKGREADRAAAEAKGARMGLERAREIVARYDAQTMFSPLRRYSPEEMANALDAEIAKAQGKSPA